MNWSNINIFLYSTWFKFNVYYKRKVLSGLSKNQILRNQKLCFTSNDYRHFHTSLKSELTLKNGVTSLPSPQEVTTILRKNEFTKEFPEGHSVKSYDSNQLASNDPIEDTRNEALCTMTKGMLMGVYDGHGGPACAQVVSKRLLNYIAAALLPQPTLQNYIKDGAKARLLESFNDKADIVADLKPKYEKSFKEFLEELELHPLAANDVPAALDKAILRLDSDLSREVIDAYAKESFIHPKTLSVALSGAVACVCHIDGPHLHVANVGDCNAVIGTLNEDNQWVAKKITKEHNAENFDELRRIWAEHPEQEQKNYNQKRQASWRTGSITQFGRL